MKNFLDLPAQYTNPDFARFVVIPFPLEKAVSFGHGTKDGPGAIIKASSQVELWDEELEQDASKLGITTLPMVKARQKHKDALAQLQELVQEVYERNQFPIVLGGEHSLTSGVLRGLFKSRLAGQPITIVQFDAHTDLRDKWDGTPLSHACAMRRALELSQSFNLVQIGIRNMAEEELPFWRLHSNRITTFFAKDKARWSFKEMLQHCQEQVYLSFDVDALDPAIMPSTGTPEPGGLNWYETLSILRVIAKEREIIGADFVELAPIPGLIAPDFLVAKLVYKFIGYLVAKS